MKRLAVVLFALMFAIPAAAEDVKESMRVKSVNGSAKHRSGQSGVWEAVRKGERLQKGQYVKTGKQSSVTLTLGEAAYIEIGAKSHIGITRLIRDRTEGRGQDELITNRIQLNQLKGRVRNSLPKHKQPSTQFEVKSPSAVTGVRGTIFECSLSLSDRFKCSVLRGMLSFTPINATSSYFARGGLSIAYAPGMSQPRRTELSSATVRRLRRFGEQANRYYRSRDVKVKPVEASDEPSDVKRTLKRLKKADQLDVTVPDTIVRTALQNVLKNHNEGRDVLNEVTLFRPATIKTLKNVTIEQKTTEPEPLQALHRVEVAAQVTAVLHNPENKETATKTFPLTFSFHVRRR